MEIEQKYAEQANAKTEKDESAGAIQKMLEDVRPVAASSAKDSCEPSPAYNQFIDQLLNRYYDPSQIKDADKLSNKFNCSIKSEEDAINYADKAVEELQLPFTDVFTKAEQDLLTTDLSGQFYGLGMSLIVNDRHGAKSRSRVDDLAPGGAAEKAGLQRGDQVLSIDGKDVSMLSHKEISAIIRSPKQEPISITVDRNGEEKTFDKVQRQLIKSNAVREPVVTDGIVHITVTTFAQDDTSEELKEAIEKHPDAKAFIIDLRKNRGGHVQEALRSLSLFMGSGNLATERERINGSDTSGENGIPAYYRTEFDLTADKIEVNKYYENMPGKALAPSIPRHPDLVNNKPVAILTDGDTASASEIFAAAMRDHKEATLIGSKTFGKGIGQVIMGGFPGGAGMSITTMRVFSPNKHWVGDGANERYGVKPDIEVQEQENAAEVARNFLKEQIAKQEKKAG